MTIKTLLVHSSRTKRIHVVLPSQKGTVLNTGGSQASFAMQAFTLTKRSFTNMSRDFGYYWLRLIIYIVVTLCIGTIYLNVGTGYSSILVKVLPTVDTTFIFSYILGTEVPTCPEFKAQCWQFDKIDETN